MRYIPVIIECEVCKRRCSIDMKLELDNGTLYTRDTRIGTFGGNWIMTDTITCCSQECWDKLPVEDGDGK
jgi:hypothetical protein